MKRVVKIARKLLPILGMLALGVGFVSLLGAAQDNQKEKVCRSIDIDIVAEEDAWFIRPKEVRARLLAEGISVIGLPLGQFDPGRMEEIIEADPFVKNAEIYMNAVGDLTIEIIQKRPILRIINSAGVSYYLDENGGTIPFSANFTARVPVATGKVRSDKILKDLEVLAKFLGRNELYETLVQQIVVLENGEFELVPEVGNHTILIGKTDNLEYKFKKLFLFYREGLGKVGWYQYKTINLKYKDQVVCTKI
jgi:cell division protein FtsQ